VNAGVVRFDNEDSVARSVLDLGHRHSSCAGPGRFGTDNRKVARHAAGRIGVEDAGATIDWRKLLSDFFLARLDPRNGRVKIRPL